MIGKGLAIIVYDRDLKKKQKQENQNNFFKQWNSICLLMYLFII